MSCDTINDALCTASEQFAEAGIDTPALDARVILSHVMGKGRTYLMAHSEDILTCDQKSRFESCVKRRAKREPVAYITNTKQFYAHDFYVDETVLIPRPETELLVETTLKKLPIRPSTVCEIGAGSGAVSTTIALANPSVHIIATDISAAALKVAAKNMEMHNVSDRVELRHGDNTSPLSDYEGRLDAIITNPPYIPSAGIPALQPEVAEYEPKGALDGGKDGLDFYRLFIPESIKYLSRGGFIAMEMGKGQHVEIEKLCNLAGFIDIKIKKDLAGIERAITAQKP